MATEKLRTLVEGGLIKEGIERMLRTWNSERGERIFADIGNDSQLYEHTTRRGVRELIVKVTGWKRVMEITGLGKWTNGELEVYVIMVDGGRNHVGDMESVKLVAGVYKDGESVTGTKPLIIEDTSRVEDDGMGIRSVKTIVSAFDKLIPMLEKLEIGEKKSFGLITNTKTETKGEAKVESI